MKRAPSSAKVFLLTPRESKNLIFSSEATFSANKGQVVKTNVIAPFGKHYSLVFESNEGEYLVHACTSNPLPSASSSEVVSDTIFAMEPILRRVSPILDHFLSCSNNKVYFLSFFSQFVSAQERIEAARWLNYAVPTKKVSPLATGAFKVSDIRCNGEKGMQCLNAHGYRISKGDSLYKKVDFHLAQKLTQDRYFEAANLGGISPALAEVQRIANQEGLSSYVDESDLLNEEPFSLADLCRLATILIKKEHVTFMKAVNSPLFTATDQILGEFLRREALARDAKVGAVDGGFPIVRGAAGGKRGGESLSLTETVWSEKLSPASAPSCCSPFPDLVHWQECAPWLDPPGLRRGLAAAMEGAVSGFRSAVGGFFSAFPDLGGVLALPSFLPFLFLGWLFGVGVLASLVGLPWPWGPELWRLLPPGEVAVRFLCSSVLRFWHTPLLCLFGFLLSRYLVMPRLRRWKAFLLCRCPRFFWFLVFLGLAVVAVPLLAWVYATGVVVVIPVDAGWELFERWSRTLG